MTLGWEHPTDIFSGFTSLPRAASGLVYRIQTVLVLTTGTLLLMWLGEQITERGIGNGISLIITVGIRCEPAPGGSVSLPDVFPAC